MTCTTLWTLDPASQLPLIGVPVLALAALTGLVWLDRKAGSFRRSMLAGVGLAIAAGLFGPLVAPLMRYGLGMAAPVSVTGPATYEVRHSDGGRIEAGKLCVAGTCTRIAAGQVGEALVQPASYPAGASLRLSVLPYSGPLGEGAHPAALARCS